MDFDDENARQNTQRGGGEGAVVKLMDGPAFGRALGAVRASGLPAVFACAALAVVPRDGHAESRQAQGRPMSAIEWLSGSVSSAAAVAPGASRGSVAVTRPVPGEAPVTGGLKNDTVSVSRLGEPSANGLGLLPAARVGLPRDLWGDTPEMTIAAALRKERVDALPSVRAFLMELLLAELDPPRISAAEGHNVLFLARIDRLLDIGALDQAMALLDLAEPSDTEIFRRRFDVALLLGEENRACDVMAETPDVSPSFPARIFCLARRGDWAAAALSFDTGRALGQITPEMADLLERFLDPELAEAGEPLPPPSRPSPLVFRLMEAIGEPMSTTSLPVAFAQADLRANTGWKSQLEAAERLTRMGVLDPNHLLGLYTQERASASGGVWDRVTVVSQLDRALTQQRTDRVAQVLPAAWESMEAQELEPALAAMFAAPLGATALPADAGEIAFRLSLLTPDFEDAARAHPEDSLDDTLLIGIATGNTKGREAQDQLGLMLKRVFDEKPKSAPPAYAETAQRQLGLTLLNVIDDITEGARGDYRRLETGLKMLRFAGFETVARRAALELVVLDRNG